MRSIKSIQESTNTVPTLPGNIKEYIPGHRWYRHQCQAGDTDQQVLQKTVVTCYLGQRKHSGMSKNGFFLDILNVKNIKELLLCHLISVFATAVFAKNLWGSWLRITVLISSSESCLVKQEEIWVAWFVFYCYPEKLLKYLVRHRELWSANILLKHSSMTQGIHTFFPLPYS